MANINFRFWQDIAKLLIDRQDGTFAERVEAYPPVKLLTDSDGASARLRVDVGQTGFFAGREFRSWLELTIPQSQDLWIKFSSPVNFILFEQTLIIDNGDIRFTSVIGGTESGTWTPMPNVGKNRMTSRPQPYYESQVTLGSGGGHTGGTIMELKRLSTANATAQATSVGGTQSDERGLPATDYYLHFENIGNSEITGIYSLFWEERP